MGGRISWKRGALRLYVVLWVGWAIGSGVIAWTEASDTVRVARLAREHISDKDWLPRSFVPLDSVPGLGWVPGAKTPAESLMVEHINQVENAKYDPRSRNPVRRVAGVLGSWAVAALIVPGALMLGIRWVWDGLQGAQ